MVDVAQTVDCKATLKALGVTTFGPDGTGGAKGGGAKADGSKIVDSTAGCQTTGTTCAAYVAPSAGATACAAGTTFSASGNTPCTTCAADATCTNAVKTACTTTTDTVCNAAPAAAACNAGATWSAAGTAPCKACAAVDTCTNGVKTTCTTTTDTVCNAAPVAPVAASADLLDTCTKPSGGKVWPAKDKQACTDGCAVAKVCESSPDFATCAGYVYPCSILAALAAPPADFSAKCGEGKGESNNKNTAGGGTSKECLKICASPVRQCTVGATFAWSGSTALETTYCKTYASMCSSASIEFSRVKKANEAAAAAAAAAAQEAAAGKDASKLNGAATSATTTGAIAIAVALACLAAV